MARPLTRSFAGAAVAAAEPPLVATVVVTSTAVRIELFEPLHVSTRDGLHGHYTRVACFLPTSTTP